MALLGCCEYRVAIYPRGGGKQLAEVEWSSLDWNRRLDDTSTATINVAGISGRSSECAGIIGSVEPWQHELGIIRSGLEERQPAQPLPPGEGQRVWCGPVQKVSFDPEQNKATINASDISQWLVRRRLHDDHVYDQVDLAVIFADYVYDAMLPENSAGLTVETTLSGVLGTRTALAAQHLLAMDQLGELARTGIDWTVIDRFMLAGGIVLPSTPSFTLVDEHFATNPQSLKDGSNSATYWGVVGAGSSTDGDLIYGDVGGVDPNYGLIERVAREDAIADAGSAIFAAQGRLDLTRGAPGIITAGTLSPDAPVDLLSLLAGTRCTVKLQQNVVPVDGDYRLASIDVSVDEKQAEAVKVSFQPVGIDTSGA